MIFLDSTSQKIQVVLEGAVSSFQPNVSATYAYITSTTFVLESTLLLTNDTTAQDLVPAPPSGFQTRIQTITVYNNDTAAVTVVIRINISGTNYVLMRAALDSGDNLTYEDGKGWQVIDNNGYLKIALSPLATVDISNDAVTFAKMQNIATDSLVGRDTAGTGDPENILLNATLSMDGSGNLQRAALTGDVTASAGSNATTIANDAVTNAKLANMAQDTIKGRATGAGTGDPTDLTTLPTGVMPALTGDVTNAAGSLATTIANDAVTNAKAANMAQSTIKGRAVGAGTGDPTDLSSAQATAILDSMVGDSGSGGTKGLVPAPSAGDAAANKVLGAGGGWVAQAGGREVLTATRTYYVRTDGSDSNTGLVNSSGGAFLTVQKAIDTIVATLDTAGYTVTIQVIAGTYTGAVTFTSPWVGGGQITILGDSSTPSNVFFNVTGTAILLTCALPAIVLLDGIKITGSVNGIQHTGVGKLQYQNIEFGASSNAQLTAGSPGAYVECTGNYSISGGAPFHWLISRGAAVFASSVTITLTGTPAFTNFANCQQNAVIRLISVTFSGSATGSRYSVTFNGVINTSNSGEAYLPGDAVGVIASGGIYDLGNSRTARRASSYATTSSTLADIATLSIPVLAGHTYRFKAKLFATANSSSGCKFSINGTCTATNIIFESRVTQTGAYISTTASKGTALGNTVANVTSVTAPYITIEGTITVNAAGDLRVQFATNTGTNTLTILQGSTFEVEDVTS